MSRDRPAFGQITLHTCYNKDSLLQLKTVKHWLTLATLINKMYFLNSKVSFSQRNCAVILFCFHMKILYRTFDITLRRIGRFLWNSNVLISRNLVRKHIADFLPNAIAGNVCRSTLTSAYRTQYTRALKWQRHCDVMGLVVEGVTGVKSGWSACLEAPSCLLW